MCGKDQFTEGQNPNYGCARFPKARNINEIQRFAIRYHKLHVTDYIALILLIWFYTQTAYIAAYIRNIRYSIQCRITHFLHCAPLQEVFGVLRQ